MSHSSTSDNARLQQLAHSPVGKLLWQYSMPAVVGMIVISLYNVVDRVFIGQWVGPEAIAGLSITLPVMNLSAALGVLIGGGAGARISLLLGAGDSDGAFRTLGNALVLLVCIALTYISIFYIFLDPVLRTFGASEVTLPYAREFLLYMLPGLLMINLALSFNNCMRASGYPLRAMVTNFIGAGLNVALDPLFINVFGLGIKGAAIATSISMTVSAVFVFAHFFDRRVTVYFRRGIYRLQWPIVAGILAIGAAPSLINAAASAVNAIINNTLMRYGGDMAVAAAGLLTTLTTMGVMIMNGISQGMQPIVGFNYGAGSFARMKRVYWLAVGAASVVAFVCSGFGMFAPELWARAFTGSVELVDSTAHACRLGLWAFWTVGFQVISTTFFMSIGKAGKSVFLSLARQVIFLIPLMLLLSRLLQLDGLWLAFPLGDLSATACTVGMIIYQWRQLRLQQSGAEPFQPEHL